MANLGDFIGNVVSNISKSRANADKQTIEIAKQYANDSLLKHFSVPRFRIDSVELNIPVAVNGYSQIITQVFSDTNKETLTKRTIEIVKKYFLVDKNTDLLDKKVAEFIRAQVNNLSIQFKNIDKTNLIKSFADSISSFYPEWVTSTNKELKLKTPLKTEIIKAQSAINNAIINATTVFTNTSLLNQVANELDVIVETVKLREIPQADKIMITMKISEHGMEWIKMEGDNGQAETRLLPE